MMKGPIVHQLCMARNEGGGGEGTKKKQTPDSVFQEVGFTLQSMFFRSPFTT